MSTLAWQLWHEITECALLDGDYPDLYFLTFLVRRKPHEVYNAAWELVSKGYAQWDRWCLILNVWPEI